MRGLLAATKEAAIRGLSARAFSFNVQGGRCEACSGAGIRQLELGVLPDLVVPCTVCNGRRFARDVLEVRWKGMAADELLALTASEAHAVLAGHPRLEAATRALCDAGLGYVPLGQGNHTLSGGELRRLRLAGELVRLRRSATGAVVVIDRPAVGLHAKDIAELLHLLRRLALEGASVWLASSDPLIVRGADAVCDVAARNPVDEPVDNSVTGL
jgi:excinuclease ABC subunit A